MSVITEIIGAHSLPELSNVCNSRELSFKGWLANKKFKVSNDIKANDFVLDIYDKDEIYIPYAFDINRMATSSFESINGIAPDEKFPKSIGWLVVRLYYSAYYACHAILRIFGISCTQFNQKESGIITEVANVWGHAPDNSSASTGYFKCVLTNTANQMRCKKLDNSHADVWQCFYDHLDKLSDLISEDNSYLQSEKNKCVEYIFNLRFGLSCRGRYRKGNWLSKIRNEVNYQHTMGTWFPYSGSVAKHTDLYRALSNWNSECIIDNLTHAKSENDLKLFVESCVSIVSLCFSLTKDLHNQNHDGFLKLGVFNFLNKANIRV
ncbi:hypothetical protein [Psychrosphaera haliotis]|uniref:Uncharacterized protein n=1 Tax=Psychrosphaera haliotis TaxID=555083 RepID=A0A6N8FEF6_9GAMM|nr:hypothetical protein [Psychrosphaera haliotis]MUH72711.1 hypothetical protein [Psychrosphaera haliotis]